MAIPLGLYVPTPGAARPLGRCTHGHGAMQPPMVPPPPHSAGQGKALVKQSEPDGQEASVVHAAEMAVLVSKHASAQAPATM